MHDVMESMNSPETQKIKAWNKVHKDILILVKKKKEGEGFRQKYCNTKWKKKSQKFFYNMSLLKYSYKYFINNNKMPDTVMEGKLWEC